MAARKRRPTADAVRILHRRYVAGRPEQAAALEDARLNAAIAEEIYALRTKAGLTQKQLAEIVGSTHSVISRLENAGYEGRSLKTLQRISATLNHRHLVRFVPLRAGKKAIE